MAIIHLTKGKSTIVDDADYEWLSQWKWFALGDGRYAVSRPWDTQSKRQQSVYMHRLILDAPSHLEVDHINGDGLDNRRCNLRLCDASSNRVNAGLTTRNTSGFKGVHPRPYGRWGAHIRFRNVPLHIGTFATPEAAARAYDAVAKTIHGQFAKINFPEQRND